MAAEIAESISDWMFNAVGVEVPESVFESAVPAIQWVSDLVPSSVTEALQLGGQASTLYRQGREYWRQGQAINQMIQHGDRTVMSVFDPQVLRHFAGDE